MPLPWSALSCFRRLNLPSTSATSAAVGTHSRSRAGTPILEHGCRIASATASVAGITANGAGSSRLLALQPTSAPSRTIESRCDITSSIRGIGHLYLTAPEVSGGVSRPLDRGVRLRVLCHLEYQSDESLTRSYGFTELEMSHASREVIAPSARRWKKPTGYTKCHVGSFR